VGGGLTHVSLFTGIGGLDLAAEWADFETILQVEMDDYANKVLEKHWPDVKRVKDIRDVTRETLAHASGYGLQETEPNETDIKKSERGNSLRPRVAGCSTDRIPVETEKNYKPVTVVSGGFPCQPFSQAGKRGGRGDDRYLWPEMLRVICELRPTWVIGENVSGLLSIDEGLEIEAIISQLEDAGYEVCPLHYPAAGVGALHRRGRVFFVANSKESRAGQDNEGLRQGIEGAHRREGSIVANSICKRMETHRNEESSSSIHQERESDTRRDISTSGAWWEVEPDVGRVVDGLSKRVDRLRCLGNAVVPQQAYPIFKAIAEVENGNNI